MTKVKRRPFVCSGTLDIECADWDRFMLSATYDGHNTRIYYDGDQMIDDLRRAGGTYWAHAGGVYDLLYVLERFRVRGISCQVDRSQHRVTRIVAGKLTLRDSYALWPAPLGDLCGAVGVPEPSLPWDCQCGQRDVFGNAGCGGYCRIAQKAAEGDPDLEAYCAADARVLYDALHLLDDWTKDHGIALRGTMGQTAWIAAQDDLGVPDSDMPYHLWRHARQGDKGGRITVVRPTVGEVTPDHLVHYDHRTKREYSDRDEASPLVVGAHHDICSAYPAQLAKAELPVGACAELGEGRAQLALDHLRPGIYTASVTVPEGMFLPPLPWHKAGMLTFPTGDFSGSWALPELVAALERGVQLRKVHTAIVWETTAPIFASLVERWYAIRRDAGKKTPLGEWVSGLSKALPGKFAERPDRERVVMHPPDIKVCTRRGQCSKGCSKRCGAYQPMDLYGYIWGVPYSKLSPSAYPQWSAYLRAGTRVQWLSQAELMSASVDGRGRPRRDGGKAVCMGNTDSLWHTSRQRPAPLGDGLGQWEFKHAWSALEVRAPAVYSYRDPATDKFHVRGIPGVESGMTEEEWRRGSGLLDRGIVTLGRAVKSPGGLFQQRRRQWSLPRRDRVWYGDRKLSSDGLTYPATADELRELQKSNDERKKRR